MAPYMKKKKVIVAQRNLKSGHLLKRGPDTKSSLLKPPVAV
jgi:hypothetical protein